VKIWKSGKLDSKFGGFVVFILGVNFRIVVTKRLGNFWKFFFFLVYIRKKNCFKIGKKWQNFSKPKICGEKEKKPGNLMLGFGGHINEHRDFTYLPSLMNHFA
jgi:hypothetical protein